MVTTISITGSDERHLFHARPSSAHQQEPHVYSNLALPFGAKCPRSHYFLEKQEQEKTNKINLQQSAGFLRLYRTHRLPRDPPPLAPPPIGLRPPRCLSLDRTNTCDGFPAGPGPTPWTVSAVVPWRYCAPLSQCTSGTDPASLRKNLRVNQVRRNTDGDRVTLTIFILRTLRKMVLHLRNSFLLPLKPASQMCPGFVIYFLLFLCLCTVSVSFFYKNKKLKNNDH